MASAKEILIKVIPAAAANNFVRHHHYSGKVVNNSMLHFGAFLNDIMHGAMSFGPSLDKRKVLKLVEGTGWHEMLELNRMAFDDALPKNSESRCIAIAIKLIKKNAPHVKWILSFADGTQCGDGAIYRASGFLLTKITKNKTIWEAPSGEVATDLSLRLKLQSAGTVVLPSITAHKATENRGASSMRIFKEAGYKPKPGFQLRYIYLIDKSCRLNCEVIPFLEIDKLNAGMYKGKKISVEERKNNLRG